MRTLPPTGDTLDSPERREEGRFVHTTRIEQQLTIMLRRMQRVQAPTPTGEVEVDRSAYGIMCRLADEGPHRLGSLAQAFGLDPSTITRQVQALEHAGWAVRQHDPTDRRAAILDLTDEGRALLHATRERRRRWLRAALSDWSEDDQQEFGRLLEQFNASLDELSRRRAAGADPVSAVHVSQ
jgi:DNA-binding MarR family transcriptional regulator